MAQYTAIFTKPYEDGYENLPSQNTPITAQTLNDKDDVIVNIEAYLSENDIPSDAEGLSYDNTDSGLTADNIQSAIDEIVTKIPTTAEDIGYDNTDSGLTADNVQGAVDELADEKVDKTGVDVKTDATGQFNTITGGLMQSCKVDLEPIQSGSGTPSPSNVRAISGHTQVQVGNVGKNKLKVTATNTTINGLTFTVNSDGSIKINGTATANTYFYPYGSGVPSNLVGKSVIANGSTTGVTIRIYHYDGTNTVQSENGNDSPTVTISTAECTIDVRVASGTTVNTTIYPMLRLATDTDATFEPYNGKTYTVNLGQTVYGGKLDIVSGSGSDEWVNIASYNGETITEPWLSSMDEYVSGTTPTTGAQVVYKKATATLFSTTPAQIETLIGENNVSVPLTGQSLDSLSYREVMTWDDVERAINVKLDLSSVAPIEYTDKASQSYNQKQLFIKDNKLCQALASISSGASFTENTNFKYTTLAEIIEPLIP